MSESNKWRVVFDEDGRHIGFRASTGEPEFHLYNGSNSTVDEVVAALNKAARCESVDQQLSRVLHEMAGAVSLCWNPRPTGVFDSTQAAKFVAAAIAELRAIASQAEWESDA